MKNITKDTTRKRRYAIRLIRNNKEYILRSLTFETWYEAEEFIKKFNNLDLRVEEV